LEDGRVTTTLPDGADLPKVNPARMKIDIPNIQTNARSNSTAVLYFSFPFLGYTKYRMIRYSFERIYTLAAASSEKQRSKREY
jgi:hypothetical protein